MRGQRAVPEAQANAKQHIRNRAQNIRKLSGRLRQEKELHRGQWVLVMNRACKIKLDDRWIGPSEVITTKRPETEAVEIDNGVQQTLNQNASTVFDGLPERKKQKTTKPRIFSDCVEGSSSADESDGGWVKTGGAPDSNNQ